MTLKCSIGGPSDTSVVVSSDLLCPALVYGPQIHLAPRPQISRQSLQIAIDLLARVAVAEIREAVTTQGATITTRAGMKHKVLPPRVPRYVPSVVPRARPRHGDARVPPSKLPPAATRVRRHLAGEKAVDHGVKLVCGILARLERRVRLRLNLPDAARNVRCRLLTVDGDRPSQRGPLDLKHEEHVGELGGHDSKVRFRVTYLALRTPEALKRDTVPADDGVPGDREFGEPRRRDDDVHFVLLPVGCDETGLGRADDAVRHVRDLGTGQSFEISRRWSEALAPRGIRGHESR